MQRPNQVINIHRLFQVCKRPQFLGLRLLFVRSMAGKDNNLDIGVGLFDPAEHLYPVNARHSEVQDHDVRFPLFKCLQGLFAIIGNIRLQVP
jgi:hypothetical protein